MVGKGGVLVPDGLVGGCEGVRGVFKMRAVGNKAGLDRDEIQISRTHLIFLTPESLEIAPPYLVHRV